MSINDNFGIQVQQHKSSFDKTTEPLGQAVSGLAHAKNDVSKDVAEITSQQAINKKIIQSTLDVSFARGNESLTLLLKTAIEELNGILQPALGVSIEEAHESGLDVSPEATATRIVSLSTAFFSAYQEQHPEMDLETAVNEFTNLIKGGIDKGFSEARGILDGLNVLQGDIATNIDTTYDLVQDKLQVFIDSVLGD